MALVAEYLLSYEHLPLVSVASAVPETTLELEIGQPNQAGPAPFVVTAAGGAFERLEQEFDRSEFVGRYTLIDEEPEVRQYQVFPSAGHWKEFRERTREPATLESLSSNRSIVERITVTPDGWFQRRRFADREEFLAYCEFWRETADSFSLRRLQQSDVGADADSPAGLTDPQREALATAYEMGYFDVPRTATLDDVASELGISAPSLSERLRRANARLVESAVSPGENLKPLTR